MTSESYSQARRDMAKKIGLGRKPGQTTAAKKPAKAANNARRAGLAPPGNSFEARREIAVLHGDVLQSDRDERSRSRPGSGICGRRAHRRRLARVRLCQRNLRASAAPCWLTPLRTVLFNPAPLGPAREYPYRPECRGWRGPSRSG